MATDLPMRVLTRMWQMLLKTLEEVAAAPNAMMAAEMAIIRLTHVADLPSPEELVRKLQNTPPPPTPPNGGGGYGGGPGAGSTNAQGGPMGGGNGPMHGAPTSHAGGGTVTALAVQNDTALAKYPTFEHVVELVRQRRDGVLRVHVEEYVRLANYQPGRIEFEPAPGAPKDLAQKLGSQLQRWTGSRWAVILVNEGGAPAIAEVRDAAENEMREQALGHPLVQAVMEAFPKSKITDIKSRRELANEALAEALPEVEDEWDPFEE